MAARKTSKNPTRIWVYGGIEPAPAALELIDDALFKANRYANKLIEIERDRALEYQATRRRYAPEICPLEEEYANADAAVLAAVTDITDHRASVFRATGEKKSAVPRELTDRVALAKKVRKDVSIRLKDARASFEALMSPARADQKSRKKALVDALEHNAPRLKEKINADVLSGMLAEDWPDAWKALALVDAKALARQKLVRAARDFGAGTGGLVEASVLQSIKDAKDPKKCKLSGKKPGPPRFRSFRGEGRLGGQVDGCSVADLFAGTNSQIRLRQQPPKLTRNRPGGARNAEQFYFASLNIGSKHRGESVWVDLPVRLHRALPTDAVVKYVWISVRRQGVRRLYELHFTLEAPSFAVPREDRTRGVGRVAVNFGWRQVDGGTRIAYWLGESGEGGSIVVPTDMLKRLTFSKALRSHADTHYGAGLRVLRSVLLMAGHRFTYWDRMSSNRKRIALMGHLRAFAIHRLGTSMAPLWQQWKSQRLGAGSDLFASFVETSRWAKARGMTNVDRLAFWLLIWERKDAHLRQYEADMRARSLNQRNAFYKTESICLARRFSELVTDAADISEMAVKQAASPESEAASAGRQVVATGRLREIMRETFGKSRDSRVATEDNSIICAGCDATIKPAPGETIVVCPTCGELDTDRNNCRNLLRRREQAGGDDAPGTARDEGKDAGSEEDDEAAE